MHPAASLPRVWWFPKLNGFRSNDSGTYIRYPLEQQPKIPTFPHPLSWLEQEPEKADWAIDQGDPGQQTQLLTLGGLEEVAGRLPLPCSLRIFASRTELQRRIGSVTACYLDLGDVLTPTTVDGGHLIHLLSDQQWCRHWLVYLDSAGNEAVVTSAIPIGFDLPADWTARPPKVIPLDGSFDLDLCADSVSEFLYRFWIENELWWALEDSSPLPQRLAEYAAQLPRVG